ncbi:MAG: Ig-like domain-containing protein [Chloroflexi bacterium]|nr:Ig-like domain-containing protein [Chloroflexota bacterium]
MPTAAPAPPPFTPPFIPATATPVPSSGGPAQPVISLEPPSMPANFVAKPGLRSIALEWEVPEQASDRPVEQYDIQSLKTGEIVRVNGTVQAYVFEDLDPAVQYIFTIKASTGLGTGPSATAGPVSPWDLPGAPTAFEAVLLADGSSVEVKWLPPESNGGTPVTGYVVGYSPVGGPAGAQTIETDGTQLTLPNLLGPGDSRSISVRAVTLAGTGPATPNISLSRPPSAASGTIATVEPTAVATVEPTEAPTVTPTAVPGLTSSTMIVISESDRDLLKQALEAITGGSVDVTETAIAAESTIDGISLVIPVQGLSGSEEISGSLDVRIGQLTLAATGGVGTAQFRISDDITVHGAAMVSARLGALNVNIVSPILRYSPGVVDDGSFASSLNSAADVGVSFAVGVATLPDGFGLTTTYSANPSALESAVGTTFTLAAGGELAYFVVVEKSGLTQENLNDNALSMRVSLGWLDEMVSRGLEIAITKISDSGQVFTEPAQCERLADHAVCRVRFTGAAGGFSIFAIYGFVNLDPQPAPMPLAEVVPTPTVAVQDSGASIAPESPSPTPELVPAPTVAESGQGDIAGFEEDGGGGGLSVIVIGAVAAVVVVAAGSAIAIFVRRPEIPTAGLLMIAIGAGSFALVVADSGVVQADEDPDIRQLNAEMLAGFDKNDFRYRKVGSGVRALSEAYRAGTLEQQPDFGELTGADAIDPGIDVTIWFESAESVDIKLLGEYATVLNHVEDVVEARVPVRFAHQLSYMPGVLRVDRIVPPQVDAITSEGTTVHGSPAWNTVGLDGTGIKVGIIDVGFQGWSSISPAELPTPAGVRCYTSMGVFTSNLSDCEVDTEHGTAVAEAVDDIAPEVELYISNPVTRGDLLATAAWMATEGVQIINYSVGWLWDGPGDGTSPSPVSPLKAVDQAVTDGILWVNSSGNSHGEAWFGSWADDSFPNNWLEFSGGDELNTITLGSTQTVTVQIRWDDSWTHADSDLDLCLFDSTLLISNAYCVFETQDGTAGSTPFEYLTVPAPAGTYYLAVFKYSGLAPAWVQLHVWSGQALQYIGDGRSITNPADSSNSGMLTVGAAPWHSTSTIESFSSQGPTTDNRIKPDIVGADAASSAAYGGIWYGTSLASPHVAGLAALVLQRFPSMTPAELATYLKDGAAERGVAGPDNVWGHGFAGLTAPAAPSAVADSYSIDEDAVLSVGAPGVLGNDSDDADAFTSTLITDASHGSVALGADGSFSYTPDADFNGSDSFDYRDVDPWQVSSVVSVGLTVNAKADVSGTSSTQGSSNPNNVGLALAANGVSTGTANFTPGSDGVFKKQLAADTFTFAASADGYVERAKAAQSVTTADQSIGATDLRAGDATGDGEIDGDDAVVLLAAFVAGLPDPGSRSDSSGNTVDLNGDGIVDAVDVSLWSSNHGLQGPMAWDTVATTPPLAIADSYWVYADTQLEVAASGVLANDHDDEADSRTATLVDLPANGSVTLNSDGSFTYDPDAGYEGADSFTYYAADAQTIGIKTVVTIDVRELPEGGGTTPGTLPVTLPGTTPGTTAPAPTTTPIPTPTPGAGTTAPAPTPIP